MQSLLQQWNLPLHCCRASYSALPSLVVLEDVDENEASQSREARPCSAAKIVFQQIIKLIKARGAASVALRHPGVGIQAWICCSCRGFTHKYSSVKILLSLSTLQ